MNDFESFEIDFLLSKFLGSWSGDELYSHTHETFIDSCLKVKISEVQEVKNTENFKTKCLIKLDFLQLKHDKADNSLRHLEIKFGYPSHDMVYSVMVNTSNAAFWKGDDFTVQVFGLKKDRLTLNVCESGKSLFTIVLKDTDEVPDLEDEPTEAALIQSIMKFKNFPVHSTANLSVNCTAEVDDAQSTGSQVSFLSIWILIFTKFLLF